MLWSVGVYDLGLTSEAFWALSPREYRALCDRQLEAQRAEDWRFGQLAALVAGVADRKKQDGTPFEPWDFFPSVGSSRLVAARNSVTPVKLPPRPGDDAVTAGWDAWVQMCRQVAGRRS
jgi:hypothetical protein